MNTCNDDNVLKELLQLLKLEKIEENIFRGQSQDLGLKNVFGGQVLGQSLSAASRTVAPAFHAHSLHGYFMRPGDTQKPIVYTVDCIRDGKSFITRRVVAVQSGQAIFSMSASFHKKEPGFDHQSTMPEIEGPDGIESEWEMAHRITREVPSAQLGRLLCKNPIEIRVVNPMNPLAPKSLPPEKFLWFRAMDKIPDNANAAVHRYLLAYASDFHLASTSLYPHGKTFWSPGIQMASLDHAIWFHRDFKMDEWLLYVMKSPNACKARGLSFGAIYTQDGTLVASVAQEGLYRYSVK